MLSRESKDKKLANKCKNLKPKGKLSLTVQTSLQPRKNVIDRFF